MLGSPIAYLKGMRVLMFQLSGFYYRLLRGSWSWAFWKRVWALGAKVWDLTARVKEP